MTVFVFIMGTLVTLIVAGAISLLIWGAILDGRMEEAEREKRRKATTGRPARSL
jgi:hypothetical protein